MRDFVRVVVLDNGASTLKAGFGGADYPSCVVPNRAAAVRGQLRKVVADEIDSVSNASSLRHESPFDRGYVTDWPLERDIWARVLQHRLELDVYGSSGLADCALLATEAPLTPALLRDSMAELVFETFRFGGLRSQSAASLTAYGRYSADEPCALVLECGHSFCHAVPCFEAQPLAYAIRRVDIGGKLLSNVLKERISYTSFNIDDIPMTVRKAKESLCYCAVPSLHAELRATASGGARADALRRVFVLPDFSKEMHGYAVGEGVAVPEGLSMSHRSLSRIALTTERFTVPELLFQPTDVGRRYGGVADAVPEALRACPPELQPLMARNVVLSGGCAGFPGFEERLRAELRPLLPSELELKLRPERHPTLSAWRGGAQLAASLGFADLCVSKEEWEEEGVRACRRKFGSGGD